ncbi:MAG: type I methionyl aminopeptidase [Candidatus Kerfeldbacteria bacterium CG08_land_8_20_14_0_20_42_7]|uniref:Methionine aminopeptidase n=1 Tax=Candidatus Kerfeldbacteria bacterium CG08_land_8_20_14_0_20_42_7 TaxID=2014245 RepID=A0A2H0YV86_9BACT|nr:MAG: type I methionyl aminopeptidase [Candidatus Kerfeldbacteria bacterium CG08_land_8_20_14_0_20_42_7]
MIQTQEGIELMRQGGKLLADVLDLLVERAHAGVMPADLDAMARDYVESRGAKPAFLGFGGFPASVCVSRDSQVVHGIPGTEPFRAGELVGFDFGVLYKGYYTDAARSVCIDGCKNKLSKKLLSVVEQSFYEGMKKVRDGAYVGDVGNTIQTFVEAQGFSVIRALVGHGVGRELHADPKVPNFGFPKTGAQLHAGMTIAVEPMIAAGSYHVVTEKDGWAVRTADNSLTAHFEHTIAITKNGYDILTKN